MLCYLGEPLEMVHVMFVFDDISNDGACDTKIDDNEMMRCLEYTIMQSHTIASSGIYYHTI